MTIQNLGKAIGIVMRAECAEMFMHADVSAWSAPSECHEDVSRGEARRMRLATRQAEAVAKAPWRVIVREARRRGFEWGGPRYDRMLGRVYHNQGYPF